MSELKVKIESSSDEYRVVLAESHSGLGLCQGDIFGIRRGNSRPLFYVPSRAHRDVWPSRRIACQALRDYCRWVRVEGFVDVTSGKASSARPTYIVAMQPMSQDDQSLLVVSKWSHGCWMPSVSVQMPTDVALWIQDMAAKSSEDRQDDEHAPAIGDVFERISAVGAVENYILSSVSACSVALVDIRTGNRWADTVSGNGQGGGGHITKEAWHQVTGGRTNDFEYVGRFDGDLVLRK